MICLTGKRKAPHICSVAQPREQPVNDRSELY